MEPLIPSLQNKTANNMTAVFSAVNVNNKIRNIGREAKW